MTLLLQTRFGSGCRALLVGLGVLGCVLMASLALAEKSSAEVPPKGLNCVASDGKINGRGSTFQILLVQKFIEEYGKNFCGSVAEQFAGDPAGSNMVAYDYPEAENHSGTGSGAGIKATSCRSDAFAGTDTPYTEANFKELNEAAGTTGGCSLTFKPPFQPQATKNEYPNAGDTTAPFMSFPIGGSSVALGVNLKEGICVKGPPTSLQFTAKEVSRLFGGSVAAWNDAELVENNPILATDECTGAVTRIVRQDSSGTTNIFKAYLVRADNNRATQKCSEGVKWETFFAHNIEWPGFTEAESKEKESKPAEGNCSAIKHASASGNGKLLALLAATNGGIAYADLPQEQETIKNEEKANEKRKEKSEPEVPVLVTSKVQNATATSFQSPNTGKAANCTYAGVVSLPGNGSASEAVGVGNTEGKNWANNAEPNEGNATDRGSKYPICGLTWDLVMTHLANGEVANPIGPMTADQRRTLYSFFTFILGSSAQNTLSTIDYAPLPAAFLQPLREGFQENF
jgi:ABC-type phosphate transport system substrate-binding protein